MRTQHLSATLKQLVKRGYSHREIHALIKTPSTRLLDEALSEHEQENSQYKRHLSAQSNQAQYAMHLGAKR